MTAKKTETRDSWTNNFGFVMATAGAAIGLGNIWRFPYVCGQNGGGAFIIVYLACVFIIGMPILIGELLIGRKARKGSGGAYMALVKKNKKLWQILGLLGVITAFLCTSYYTIIAGWTLEYLLQTLQNSLPITDAASSKEFFDVFMASDDRQIFWHVMFSVVTTLILMGGVSGGIEKVTEFLMPILFFILIGLAAYALNLEISMAKEAGTAVKSFEFLFKPDWSQFKFSSMFDALGQAAFSLSIGVGTLIAYGSYLDKKENITTLGSLVVCMDTAVGLLGGLVIFPIVFAFGLDPEAGTGLIFVTLPTLFLKIPGGVILAPVFYILLFFAALTSSISLLEPVVTHFVDEMKKSRLFSCVVAGSANIAAGIIWVLTDSLESENLLTNVDKIVSNLLVPLGAILVCVFLGWAYSESSARRDLRHIPTWLFQLFRILWRWVCPVIIAVILIRGLPF